MQVRWFKDDAAINVQTSYRSMWTTLVPKNSKRPIFTAILGFEKAHMLDSGESSASVVRCSQKMPLFSGDVVCLLSLWPLQVKGKQNSFGVNSCIIALVEMVPW
ncbi:hypothetical protein CEXT_80161 [Caerostris extrusa]|uniref:Uncharacterized protein n=1 Tax=Caerostris extrusa TaxID=172846 RepID=A0AAV4NFR5_CAEEX|nr:hypothetical protein CEXT_80161 [Caerostris extrusa]